MSPGETTTENLHFYLGFTRILMELLFMEHRETDPEHRETDPEHGKDGLKDSSYIDLKSGGGSWLSGNVKRR